MTRLLAQGEPIQVWGPGDSPAGFVWRGASHRIEAVCNRWQVHTRWWEAGEVVWREYWKVTTEAPQGVGVRSVEGMLCELYHDRLGGGWFLARVYD